MTRGRKKKDIGEYESYEDFARDVKGQVWQDRSDLTRWHYRRAVTAVMGGSLNVFNNDNECRDCTRNIAEMLGLFDLR